MPIKTIGYGLLSTTYLLRALVVVLGITVGGLMLSTHDPQARLPSLLLLAAISSLTIRVLLFEYFSITVAENGQWTFRALLRHKRIRVDRIVNMRRLQNYGIGGVRTLRLSLYDDHSNKLRKVDILTTSEKSSELGLGRFGYRRASLKRSNLKQDITIDDESSREQFLKAFV
ncbi:MAG: hypothetical protein HKL80_05040 [Acidimicrobiales bacterium]|nr:hypothetical protein [Acidimicrobiales bacterium]